MPIYKKIFLYKGMNKLVCLKTQINITSCSCDSRDCRDSRETLKYGTFGCEKFGFRAMSRRIWKLCVASLLIILWHKLCFPAPNLLQSKPPLCQSAVIHDGGEPRRERRRKSVSSASEAFQPLQPLSQRYLSFQHQKYFQALQYLRFMQERTMES